MGSTHNKVAHAWANQTGKNKNGFRMYYEGATIYSHGRHFPIARIVYNDRSERHVLMTSRSYSVSTSKHKTIVWRALNYSAHCVDNVLAETKAQHVANVWAMVQEIADLMAKAKRARKYGPSLREQAAQRLEQATAYANAFDVGTVLEGADLEQMTATLNAANCNGHGRGEQGEGHGLPHRGGANHPQPSEPSHEEANGMTDNIKVVKVKRSSGKETETQLLKAHGLAVMVNDDGSVCIEAYPSSSRADGIRLYIDSDSAIAAAPQWAAWARIRSKQNAKG